MQEVLEWVQSAPSGWSLIILFVASGLWAVMWLEVIELLSDLVLDRLPAAVKSLWRRWREKRKADKS